MTIEKYVFFDHILVYVKESPTKLLELSAFTEIAGQYTKINSIFIHQYMEIEKILKQHN